MKAEIQVTADGSQTLFVAELDEHYHSVKGALTESKHIFISTGLNKFISSGLNKPDSTGLNKLEATDVRVLEVGFGTGLNAILTLQEAETQHRHVRYTSLEKYPLTMSVAEQLDYPKLVDSEYSDYFLDLHRAEWNHWVDVTPYFHLRKVETDFTTLQIREKYDVIYFDAFAPEKQEEMWSEEIFRRMYDCLDPNGILVTYCAKGVVRRTLQSVGFQVERLPGPPNGKREILRATKITLL